MSFTEAEQEFLGGCHNGIEKRSAGIPALPEGMPEAMRQRALEARSKLLGRSFTEFRSRRSNLVREVVHAMNLSDLL